MFRVCVPNLICMLWGTGPWWWLILIVCVCVEYIPVDRRHSTPYVRDIHPICVLTATNLALPVGSSESYSINQIIIMLCTRTGLLVCLLITLALLISLTCHPSRVPNVLLGRPCLPCIHHRQNIVNTARESTAIIGGCVPKSWLRPLIGGVCTDSWQQWMGASGGVDALIHRMVVSPKQY